MKSLKKSFWILFLFFSCNKDAGYLPNVAVNYRAVWADPALNALNNPGNSVIIKEQGIAGIIISRDLNNRYIAFDRCSTVNPEKKCAVVLDRSGFTATDPCSGAMFSLFDGSALKAPATRPLKQYRVYADESAIMVLN